MQPQESQVAIFPNIRPKDDVRHQPSFQVEKLLRVVENQLKITIRALFTSSFEVY